ncbi:MAG: nucleotide-binding protein [Tannerellaceae bacterium]|jgi:hypothetical protein|nr:nucleotide-binding protein [Tannerellaceae bacterium]
MSNQIEKIFIVWGGNHELALLVSGELKNHGFLGIVGGENPVVLNVNNTVFSQINQCTRAIVLIEKKYSDASNPFNNNLMFELGYLTAKREASKLHIFLIGVLAKDLPSDLLGTWVNEIGDTENKELAQIAKEIANIFCQKAFLPVNIDKLMIFGNWIDIKRNIYRHTSEPVYSEIELAHYLLHSMEACYYYEDQKNLLEMIRPIQPVSNELRYVLKLVASNARLFEESFMLMRPLPTETYHMLKDFFSNQTMEFQDKNLSLWITYFRYNRLGLTKLLALPNEDEFGFGLDYKRDSFSAFIEYNDYALNALDEICTLYDNEEPYTNLYKGYVFRDLYKAYTIMSEIESNQSNGEIAAAYREKAGSSILQCMAARRTFYSEYGYLYPNDNYLLGYFADEYYLSCIEGNKFIENQIDRRENELAVRSYYSKTEKSKGRLHAVKMQFKSAYEDAFSGEASPARQVTI